jgi:CsoR family transcriptional regulator, copper-sensing transcriptional repressor
MAGMAVNTLGGYFFAEAVCMKAEAAKRTLNALKRIEGQVRGVAKMVEEDRYCIDIVTQVEAARAALAKVETDLLRQHLQHCVRAAMKSPKAADQERVIEELVAVFKR